MKKVFKYAISLEDEFTIKMPMEAECYVYKLKMIYLDYGH